MYGFQQNEVTLQDAFKFKPFMFQNLGDHNFKHVNLQNNKFWAFTKRSFMVVRSEITKFGEK